MPAIHQSLSLRRFLFVFCLLNAAAFLASIAACPTPCSDQGPVTSTTPLVSFLQRVQSTALQTLGPKDFDAKLYVDLPLKFDLPVVEAAFNRLLSSANGNVTVGEFKRFSDQYFGTPGSDLVLAKPGDFVPVPKGFLPLVKNDEVRAWALQVHAIWRNLSRKVADDVKERTDRHTLLPLLEPFVIPGARFTEVYYWDSYWVIRGLLASKMHDTARSIVRNLLSLIDKYGFVLNGARAYYTNRSQPPLLSAMILEIYNRTGDLELVRKAFPLLLKEHMFWNSGIHEVTIQDDKGCKHVVSRYYAMWNKPRPESATIDVQTASNATNATLKEHIYREVASTAESGWDFSSRWMCDTSNLATLATTSIIPVDLNAYILQMELNVFFFAKLIGNESIAEKFSAAYHARHAAINSLFWNDEMGQWLDYWLKNESSCKGIHYWKRENQNKNIFASNFVPLWIPSFYSDRTIVGKAVRSLKKSGLIRDAGIATSLTNTTQQWDFPNGWPPLQHMIVEGLVRSRSKKARRLAEIIAVKWIRANYASFKKTGAMHEKYDVESCGETGGGGEYATQTGFGWSNGVVLAFLEEFGWPKDRNISCQRGQSKFRV